MYRRNTKASSSRPSSATHANARGSASAHFVSNVVLPYPAGATTVANGDVDAHSRVIASAFATVPGRGDGPASLTSTRLKGTSATGISGRLYAADHDAFSYQRDEEDPRGRA